MSVTAADKSIEGPAAAESTSVAAAPARVSGNGWIWQVTGLSIAMGVLLALALRTTGEIEGQGLPNRFGVSAASLSQIKDQNTRLTREIRDLRQKAEQFRLSRTDAEKSRGLLRTQLAEYRAILGFAPVKGPGVKIVLRNSPVKGLSEQDAPLSMANEQDVNGLVSELWAAGAEAVAIAGTNTGSFERVVLSTVFRGSGNGVEVNGRVLTAPYEIQAIGNPKDLRAALEMTGGIIDNRELKILQMITIQEAQNLVLPEYHGSRRARRTTTPDS